jgi:hypothetical protein
MIGFTELNDEGLGGVALEPVRSRQVGYQHDEVGVQIIPCAKGPESRTTSLRRTRQFRALLLPKADDYMKKGSPGGNFHEKAVSCAASSASAIWR